jgi:hypothetical protein
MSKIKFSLEYDFPLKYLIDIEYLKHLNYIHKHSRKYLEIPLSEIEDKISSNTILEKVYFFDGLEKGNIIIDMSQNLNTENPVNFIGKRINFNVESIEYELLNPNDENGNYVIRNPMDSSTQSLSPKDLEDYYIYVFD